MKTLMATAITVAALAADATPVNFTVQTATHPDDFKTFGTEKIRSRFVMEKVMVPDEINVTYTMYDRLVYGGAMPVEKELALEPFEELKAEYFLERRELGAINVGGAGVVTVDGTEYELDFKEALYVGCGSSPSTGRTPRSSTSIPRPRTRST